MRKLLFTFSVTLSLLLAGCGQYTTTQVVVKPSQQTVQFPKPQDIQHAYILAGLAARSYTPKNQSETVAQTVKWLQTGKPVSVQLPPPTNPPIVILANTNPAVLELQLSSKKLIWISPTSYMTVHSQVQNQAHSQELMTHFVNDVISYHVENKTFYLKDPELYNWLKNYQWQSQFYISSDEVNPPTAVSSKAVLNSTTTLWVESYGIGQPNNFYKLTNIMDSHIGKMIWSNRNTTNGPGAWEFPDQVVALYEIPGRDVNKVIAAKLLDGSYVEADFVGNKQP